MKPRQHAEKLFQDGVPVNEVADELRLPEVIVEKWYETYEYKIKNASEIDKKVKKYLRKKR